MKDNAEDIALLLKAFAFAANKHQHQRRKGENAVPYINHPIRVADILWEIGQVRDIPTTVAGILHDTIEDTETSPEELEQEFGAHVLSIIEEVTDDKRLPKATRKQRQIERAGRASLEARQIKLADKISNVQELSQFPPAGWSLKRQGEYIAWAEKVIAQLRGTNAQLEQHFDTVCQQAKTHLAKKSKQS